MNTYSSGSTPRCDTPSQEGYFDFLIRCHFGEGQNPLRLCVERAYLDVNRTLHGFVQHKDAETLREKAHQFVATLVNALPWATGQRI